MLTRIDDGWLAAVDYINGIPLYIVDSDSGIYVTDSQSQAVAELSDPQIDEVSALELETATFISGSNTLVESINQSTAGMLAHIVDGTVDFRQYFNFEYGDQRERNEYELYHVWTKALLRLMDYADGREIWIPLTGGYDTRLIIVGLVNAGYENLHAYAWGVQGHGEVDISRQLANALGVDWHRVVFDKDRFYEWYRTDDRVELDRRFTLTSIPWLREWASARRLVQDDVMSEDAVVVNGCSGGMVSGAKIPTELLDREHVSRGEIEEMIIEKHYDHRHLTDADRSSIRGRLQDTLDFDGGTPVEAIEAFERFDWRERQAKLPTSSSRAHDVTGLDWWLPWWDGEVVDFFLNTAFEQRHKRRFQRTAVQAISDATTAVTIPCNPRDTRLKRVVDGIRDTALWPVVEHPFERLIKPSYYLSDHLKRRISEGPRTEPDPADLYQEAFSDGELGIMTVDTFEDVYEEGDTLFHPFTYRAQAILGEIELDDADHPYTSLVDTDSDRKQGS
ncbi:hypothetical protein [Halorhabdus sp. SVX81]|uniref:hypothetical protein n=1 Tax=Halorhabdus sp. SVX81 TaxID=2978283 RepID=UPI0023DCD848|nr:hypothetical protein [Halorhabdus sp. SVX81]